MSLAAVPPVDPVRGSEQRMLPNDMLAEQSALGGMLLSSEAVAEVQEAVKGADFYAPSTKSSMRLCSRCFQRVNQPT